MIDPFALGYGRIPIYADLHAPVVCAKQSKLDDGVPLRNGAHPAFIHKYGLLMSI